jgi:acyl-CoA dehydrogenase
MIQLDDRLLTLRKHAGGWATELREHALAADLDGGPPRALDSVAVAYLRRTGIPPEFSVDPPTLEGYRYHGMSTLERVVAMEELAAGDVGTVLAAPGASLSGVLVGRLGDEAQKESFFGRLQGDADVWTFFALTEPSGGSDAGGLTTRLSADGSGGYRLTGAKRFVGNAHRAALGVVFGRTGPGPLRIVAVLVETDDPGYTATPLPMIGLRAAQICAIDLEDVAVPADRLLGRHLSASARGLWPAVQTFNTLRPGVAAMAVGIARAALDHVSLHRRRLSAAERDTVERLTARLVGVRQLVYAAAVAVDADARDGAPASAAKARATALAEDATLTALRLFGPGARLDHPWLDKLSRDALGVEFMEGARDIQRLTVAQQVAGGRHGR